MKNMVHIFSTNIQLNNGKITIPFHTGKDLKIKTAKAILEQAGIDYNN